MRIKRLGCLLVILLVLAGLVLGIYALGHRSLPLALPAEKCVARVGDRTAEVDLEQAEYAALISGTARRRSLPPRAASIALATAFQESDLRNLTYGDRDSVGLFQQRPSAGWGSKKQILDPYYATARFYAALVKVPDWRTGDINDVAQKVQISAYPDAYAQHVSRAKALASALTGQTPAAFSCLQRSGSAADPRAFLAGLTSTFGEVDGSRQAYAVQLRTDNDDLAWAYGSYAVAYASVHGVVSVRVGDQVWRTDGQQLPAWTTTSTAAGDPAVAIAFREE